MEWLNNLYLILFEFFILCNTDKIKKNNTLLMKVQILENQDIHKFKSMLGQEYKKYTRKTLL